RAVVRNLHTGTDRIRRLCLEFLDRTAPSHMVPDDPSGARPNTPASGSATPAVATPPAGPTPPVPHTPPPPPPPRAAPRAGVGVTREEVLAAFEPSRARSHFEVLGLPSTA